MNIVFNVTSLLVLIIVLVIPGIVFVRNRRYELDDFIYYCVLFSLATWTVVFPFTKFVPLTIPQLFIVVTVLAFFIFLIGIRNKKYLFPILLQKIEFYIFVGIILCVFLPLFIYFLAPSGIDITAYSYMANVIKLAQGFPDTYEPIVPIHSFGSVFTGFSFLTALISTISHQEVYRVSMLVVCFIHLFFTFSLYVFSKYYFSKRVSIILALSTIFLYIEPLSYLWSGGSLTIFSIALLLGCINYFLYHRKLTKKYVFIPSVALLYASVFTAHHIPFVISLIILIPYLLYQWYRSKRKSMFVVECLLFLLFVFIFTFQFFVDLKLPSNETRDYIYSWQTSEDLRWEGSISNALITIPQFFMRAIGELPVIIVCIGILISLKQKRKHRLKFLAILLCLMLFIMNSVYWILPLSEFLYPRRIITLFIFPYLFFTGSLLTVLEYFISRLHAKKLIYVGLSCIIIISLINGTKTLYKNIEDNSTISKDDLEVFEWIEEYLPTSIIIANNYGDSGLWIPTIIDRKIVSNHANPYDFDEISHAQSLLKPTHIFIGSRVYLPYAIEYTHDTVNGAKLYSYGNAAVYKINTDK